MLLTGATAALYFDTLRLGKCRQISLAVDREALPTTKLGDIDRTFVSGLRDTKGSATLYYDPTDPAVEALLMGLFTDSGPLPGVDLVFDTHSDEKFSGSVVLTNAAISASFGGASVCEVQFQISGKPASRYLPIPPVTPPTAAAKWMAYTTENETYVNSHSIELDSQGNTYAFIAGGNGAHSEVTKFSPAGELLGVWRVTSYLGQPQVGSFNGPDNRRLAVGQTIHKINDDRFLLCITDRGQQTSLILLDSSGTVIYNKAYSVLPYGAPYRTLSLDKSKFIIVSDASGFSIGASAYFFDVTTGACIKRITFSNLGNQIPWIIRAVVERPDGNWAFYVRYNLAPYDTYFIEANSTLTAVSRAVHHNGLPISDIFCARPDADGYLVLNSSGYIQHLDNNFDLVESRKFAGWPTGIKYDSNGNYLIWSNYVDWYQDIDGIPGSPSLLTLIKYNWENDFVSFVTVANTGSTAALAIDPVLQRVSFASASWRLAGGGSGVIPPYRQVSSLNFIQPVSSNGLPLTTPNPPNFSFGARTVLNPTPRPTIESPVYTQRQDAINIISQPLPTERSFTFIVEPVTRTWQLISTPS